MISVIIPLYNKQDCIKLTIDSCLNQDYDLDYEIVVVDDGSTDNSLSVIESLNSNKVKLFKKQNGGPSSARNYGVEKANGEWIVFLDADDRLCKHALSHFSKLAKDNPERSCFCANYYIQHGGHLRMYSHFYKKGEVKNPFKSWIMHEFMPRAGASMFHKNILQKYPFKEYLHRYEDADVLFDMMRNETFVCSKKAVMIYNTDSLSASSFRKNIQEDFLGYLSMTGKCFWERVILSSFYEQCRLGYPDDCSNLYDEKDFLDCSYNVAKQKCKRILKLRLHINKILDMLNIKWVF